MAPRVGFEPTTSRLTAGCSTTELPRNRCSKEGGYTTTPPEVQGVDLPRMNFGGLAENRTRVHGFAIRCVTTPPPGHPSRAETAGKSAEQGLLRRLFSSLLGSTAGDGKPGA